MPPRSRARCHPCSGTGCSMMLKINQVSPLVLLYDPDGLLRTSLDSGGLNLDINKTRPEGRSEVLRKCVRMNHSVGTPSSGDPKCMVPIRGRGPKANERQVTHYPMVKPSN